MDSKPSDFPSSSLPTLRSTLFLLVVLVACVVIYWPGLAGNFALDDHENLRALGQFRGVYDLKRFIIYVTGGFSGPTGRPISLLSFLINDNSWPSDPWSFKYTNLMLHILNGCLLFLVMLRFLCLADPSKTLEKASWIAALGTAFWLLHPLNVSTTLYVVQRMTELCAFFVLLGVLGYVHGRSLLEHRRLAGHLWMSAALILGTSMAVLSKENGALLPLLVLVIEYSLFQKSPSPTPAKSWRWLFLVLPSLAVLLFMGWTSVINASATYGSRSFTLGERLLTESRVLLEYMQHLLLPKVMTSGLFNDDYAVSTGLLTPPFTLVAIMAIAGLVLLGLWSRCRYPLLSLALLFFFAGHLMESTVIALEIYFEHRNYLPAMFLFLPLAAGFVNIYTTINRRIAIASTVSLVVLLSLATWQRASSWGQPTELLLVWAQKKPLSPRAQSAAAIEYEKMGRKDLALAHLEKSLQAIPNSVALHVQYLFFKAVWFGVNGQEVARALNVLSKAPYDFSDFRLLRYCIDLVISERTQGITIEDAHAILNALEKNPSAKRHSSRALLQLPHLHGLLYTNQNQPDAALSHFDTALTASKNVEVGLSQTVTLASQTFYTQAIAHLRLTERVLQDEAAKTPGRPRREYLSEIQRLMEILKNDFEQKTQEAL